MDAQHEKRHARHRNGMRDSMRDSMRDTHGFGPASSFLVSRQLGPYGARCTLLASSSRVMADWKSFLVIPAATAWASLANTLGANMLAVRFGLMFSPLSPS